MTDQELTRLSAQTLHRAVTEAAARLERLLTLLELEAAGITSDLAAQRPLQALAEAGELDGALLVLKALAQRPAFTMAALELVGGSPLEVVARAMPL